MVSPTKKRTQCLLSGFLVILFAKSIDYCVIRLRHKAGRNMREDTDASRIFTKKEPTRPMQRGENGIITDRLLQVWKSHVGLFCITIYPHTISDSDFPAAYSSLFAKTGDYNRKDTFLSQRKCCFETLRVKLSTYPGIFISTITFEQCNTCHYISHDNIVWKGIFAIGRQVGLHCS